MSKEISKTVKGSASKYLIGMAEDKRLAICNTHYTIVPHKLLRCINLSPQAKIILLDLLSYMGDSNSAYPPIEDIALNCGMSHATVQKFIMELEEKRILKIHRRHNNTYYLLDELKLSGYITLSEILHKFRRRMKRAYMVSEKLKNKFLKGMVTTQAYADALDTLEDVRVCLSNDPTDGWKQTERYKSAISAFVKFVEDKLETTHPVITDTVSLEDIKSVELRSSDYSGNSLPY